jgi:hypothetical protein
VKARFNDRNKIVSAEITFDVMGFMQQLQKASSISPESNIVPNTLDAAMHASTEPRVLMRAEAPYRVLYVNEAWSKQSNVTQSEIEGKPFCQELHSSPSQLETLLQTVGECAGSQRPGSVVVMTAARKGCPRPAGGGVGAALHPNPPNLLYVRFLPISGDLQDIKKITHVLAIETQLPLTQAEASAIGKYLASEGVTAQN